MVRAVGIIIAAFFRVQIAGASSAQESGKPDASANCSLPALSVGPRLTSSKQLSRLVKRERLLLAAFSAVSCARCCTWEPLYQDILPFLEAKKVTFVRVDMDQLATKSLAATHGIENLPTVVFFKEKKPVVLHEPHSNYTLRAFVHRILDPLPLAKLASSVWIAWRSPGYLYTKAKREIEDLMEKGRDNLAKDLPDLDIVGVHALRIALILGPKGRADEDLEEELVEAAMSLASRPLSVRFARAADAEVRNLLADHPDVTASCGGSAKAAAAAASAKSRKSQPLLVAFALFDGEYIDIGRLRPAQPGGIFVTPNNASTGLVFNRRGVFEQGDWEVIPRVICRPLNAYDGASVHQWVLRAGLPPAGRFDEWTSSMYEMTSKPMLMLFVDESNARLPFWLKLFQDAHRKYNNIGDSMEDNLRLVFTYIDAEINMHRMTILGLVPDLVRTPALGFNGMGDRLLVWQPPAESYKNGSAVLDAGVVDSMVQRYLHGEGGSASDTSAPKSIPVPQRDMKAGEKRTVPDLESLSLDQRLRFVPALNMDSFNAVVMDSAKDVAVFLFNSVAGKQKEASEAVAIYVNRVKERFTELDINTIEVARLDTGLHTPPTNFQFYEVPSLVLFPAFSKEPPWITFRRKWKVQNIMWWIMDHASRKFKLPKLPHLDEIETDAYWEQKAELPPDRQRRIGQMSETSKRIREADMPEPQSQTKKRRKAASTDL